MKNILSHVLMGMQFFTLKVVQNSNVSPETSTMAYNDFLQSNQTNCIIISLFPDHFIIHKVTNLKSIIHTRISQKHIYGTVHTFYIAACNSVLPSYQMHVINLGTFQIQEKVFIHIKHPVWVTENTWGSCEGAISR